MIVNIPLGRDMVEVTMSLTEVTTKKRILEGACQGP